MVLCDLLIFSSLRNSWLGMVSKAIVVLGLLTYRGSKIIDSL